MGTVFQAFDRRTRQLVAVKVLHSKGENDAARFERESELLAELKSPAIVRFIDHGTTTHGEPFYVMEWLDGETLDERLRRGTLPAGLVARLGARVLEALGEAHAHGVIHRDMKPSNIFLAGYKVSEAKLIDFGVARRTDEAFRLTRQGNTVGTPMYNAPEQARGRGDLDGRVDIFALGCVLFEALTGEPAYSGDTPGQVMGLIASGQGPDLEERLPLLDSELRTVLDAMMAFRREERPADARGLAARMLRIAERLERMDAPAPLRPRRASATPAPAREAVSSSEQRVMSVLVLACFARTHERPALGPGKGAPLVLPDDLLGRLAHLLEPFGGRLDRLLDRSLIITAPAVTSLLAQAEQIARMALAIAAAEPQLTIAMATGRAVLLARLPAGPVIEQAATLLEQGAVGVVNVDDNAARLLSAAFSITSEGNLNVLTAEREGLPQPRRILNQVGPFVGRERDLAQLTGVLGECKGDLTARAVILTSRAGLGKSRAVGEWIRRMHHQAFNVLVLSSRATPYAAGPPYQALSGIFDMARIPPADRVPEVVEGRFAQWLKTQCARRPVILLLEDAHVADMSSLQLLDSLLGQLGTSPLMVIVTGRPELDERVPDLFESRAPVRMRLAPLARRHGESILRGLLPSSAPEVDAWILERCRGTAFLLEELARTAIVPDGGRLPDTVAGFIEGELEALGAEGRKVLRAASVYGDSFDTAGVAALVGPAAAAELDQTLRGLAERGLLLYDGENAETPWRFAEVVVRETVHAMLAPGDRLAARRVARTYLQSRGRLMPDCLRPGDSAVTATPSHSPALGSFARR